MLPDSSCQQVLAAATVCFCVYTYHMELTTSQMKILTSMQRIPELRMRMPSSTVMLVPDAGGNCNSRPVLLLLVAH